ncbi:MAG: helix-turn-helix domain-containing protein [Oscillospiraceae bacterium]|nr:helix-turn-helix domain-containing protein [Oscillospiraceae bacterium]
MRLKELRKQHKLRQSDVAAVINCSQAVYSRYENGERMPSMDILKALAQYYSVTVDYLVEDDSRPAPSPAQTSAQAFQQLDPDRTRYAQQLRAREHYGPSYQPPQPVSVSESRTEGESAQYMGEAPRTPAEEAAQIRAYIITQLSDSLQRLSTEHFKQAVDYVALLELKEKMENSAEKK